ncbi:phage terminase large subunit [Actinoplanes sp. NPDC023936]|uniref:phage terminase large subunit n=1 Tax=Actinoplanes sp. NPDC023936 TaxID=3154910 RepID=UPI0034073C06
MVLFASHDLDVWEPALEAIKPRQRRRWASPLDMAAALDKTIVRTPALNLINDALVHLAEGREDRLMISMPPQEAKSSTVAYRFPTWLLADLDPDQRIIIISYSDDVARRWGADIKRDFETFDGTDDAIDLGVRLRADSRAAGRWQVEGARGGVFASGVAGSVTGRPADLILIDDPIKDLEQAQSAIYRERFQRFWQGVAVPRLGPGAKVCLIQTRWHEEDAAGWLLQHEGDRAKGGRWKVINIPAQCEDEDTDPLGRCKGEYMISARGNRDWDAVKKSVGSYVWAALYQGRPAPAEGGLFKRIHWRYHTIVGSRIHLGGREFDLRDCWRFATVDLAASTRTSADYTVIAAWARTISGDLVLLDLVRARIGEEQHFAQARPLVQRWNLDTVFIEASQYGTTLVREATNDHVPISPIQAEQDKFSRALPYSAWVSSGRVWLPSGNPHWLTDFLNEHASFPAAAHDDTIDVGSLAVRVAVTQWQPSPAAPRRAQAEPSPFGAPAADLASAPM